MSISPIEGFSWQTIATKPTVRSGYVATNTAAVVAAYALDVAGLAGPPVRVLNEVDAIAKNLPERLVKRHPRAE